MLKIDPAAFGPDAAAPETLALAKEVEDTLRDAPKTHEVPPEETRRAREEGKGIFPSGGPLPGSEWREVPTGPGRVRVTAPTGRPTGVFIHLHGGGWTLGAPQFYDEWARYLADEVGCVVVSLPYRLAPENPWPACADDAEAGALWVLGAAKEAFGTDRIAIGGESAGAHLSAVTLGRLKGRGLADRICGALLHYGAFDLAMTPSMANWGERPLVLSTPTVEWFVDNLAAPDLTDPDVSPLRADLSGMPPALFQCGTQDPLIDDSLFMAARWTAAGGKADLRLYPGAFHAFDMFDIAVAKEARAAGAGFLRRCFTEV